MSVDEAFREFGGLSLIDLDPGLARKARELGISSVGEDDDFETAYFKILVERVEPRLERLGGVVLYDYPASQAVLAKVEGDRAKRFEFYLGGVELCNAFLELIDPAENRRRIEAAYARRGELSGDADRAEPSPDEEFMGLEGIARVIPFRGSGMFR
jgi:lysyl-tRNA synthetase class 2